jgi:DNA-binding helix-hairpin-helix protein with protein kinase domain
MKDLPERGDTLHLDRTGEPVAVGQRVGEGAQGVVHKVAQRTGRPLALKWYRRATDTPAQRSAIRELTGRPNPHEAFLFPMDTITTADIGGFGYIMPWMDQRFSSFAQVINDPQPLGLQTKARIGRKLAEAFGALHASGLCYRDINFGNLWVDPLRGDVAIIDNDNVGIDDGHAAVWGVLRFMAPEVVRREQRPSTVTDLHSLAVLLFYLLLHGHPLDGQRVEAGLTWDEHRRSEEELALAHYGNAPLFVFDPTDASNRPDPDQGPSRWWPLYPSFVQRPFVQAFTVGLRDATLAGRVLATTWRDTFVRMSDLCSVCPHCTAAVIADPDEPGRRCWHCDRPLPPVPMLRLRSGRSVVLLAAGAMISNNHLGVDRNYDTMAAHVEPHPGMAGSLVLRNRSTATWTAQPDGEDALAVEPGQAFAVRPATINFGTVRGEIVLPSA